MAVPASQAALRAPSGPRRASAAQQFGAVLHKNLLLRLRGGCAAAAAACRSFAVALAAACRAALLACACTLHCGIAPLPPPSAPQAHVVWAGRRAGGGGRRAGARALLPSALKRATISLQELAWHAAGLP